MNAFEREARNVNIVVNWQAGMSSQALADRFELSVVRVNEIVRDWRYNHRTGIRPADVKRRELGNLPGMVRKASADRELLAVGKKKLVKR